MQDSLIEKIKPYIKNYDSYLVGGYLRDLLSGEISPIEILQLNAII